MIVVNTTARLIVLGTVRLLPGHNDVTEKAWATVGKRLRWLPTGAVLAEPGSVSAPESVPVPVPVPEPEPWPWPEPASAGRDLHVATCTSQPAPEPASAPVSGLGCGPSIFDTLTTLESVPALEALHLVATTDNRATLERWLETEQRTMLVKVIKRRLG